MLRDTDYLKMANEYSTSIGMATWINFEAKGDMLKRGRGYLSAVYQKGLRITNG
jgi:hypothetical protein